MVLISRIRRFVRGNYVDFFIVIVKIKYIYIDLKLVMILSFKDL